MQSIESDLDARSRLWDVSAGVLRLSSTLVGEKLRERDIQDSAHTLRRWLLRVELRNWSSVSKD